MDGSLLKLSTCSPCGIWGVHLGIYLLLLFCSLFHFWTKIICDFQISFSTSSELICAHLNFACFSLSHSFNLMKAGRKTCCWYGILTSNKSYPKRLHHSSHTYHQQNSSVHVARLLDIEQVRKAHGCNCSTFPLVSDYFISLEKKEHQFS